jgi:hypothetical protein
MKKAPRTRVSPSAFVRAGTLVRLSPGHASCPHCLRKFPTNRLSVHVSRQHPLTTISALPTHGFRPIRHEAPPPEHKIVRRRTERPPNGWSVGNTILAAQPIGWQILRQALVETARTVPGRREAAVDVALRILTSIDPNGLRSTADDTKTRFLAGRAMIFSSPCSFSTSFLTGDSPMRFW